MKKINWRKFIKNIIQFGNLSSIYEKKTKVINYWSQRLYRHNINKFFKKKKKVIYLKFMELIVTCFL